MSGTLRVYFNPSCSKCRAVREILETRGTPATYIHYLEAHPSREDLEATMHSLGIRSPREMMRTSEPVYAELGLADADDERLLVALLRYPILLERPIVVDGDRAVIARPPEKVLDLF
jgi:arsenate reductase (glutaredoxin)